MGMDDTAEALLRDESVRIEADFNPTKTWIEYFNRLTGVAIGMLIFAVFVYSLKFWSAERRLTIIALLTLLLVSFQGWLGSFVVSTNLTPWTITVHMFLALVIVALLVYLVHAASQPVPVASATGVWWLMACIAVVLVQILLGTHVREAFDGVGPTKERSQLITAVSDEFVIHRSFSWMVLLLHVGLVMNLRRNEVLKRYVSILITLILLTIATGVAMAWFGVPAFLQPVHLTLATICFGVQFLFVLRLNRKEPSVLSK
jgi:cytochrome c oxidase assembly protein subunit 15